MINFVKFCMTDSLIRDLTQPDSYLFPPSSFPSDFSTLFFKFCSIYPAEGFILRENLLLESRGFTTIETEINSYLPVTSDNDLLLDKITGELTMDMKQHGYYSKQNIQEGIIDASVNIEVKIEEKLPDVCNACYCHVQVVPYRCR